MHLSVPAAADDNQAEVTVNIGIQQISVKGNAGSAVSSSETSSELEVARSEDFAITTGLSGDGYIQLLVEVKSPTSPTSYDFYLPGVIDLEVIEVGNSAIYRLIGVDGETRGWLSKPWARDANHVDVPTTFSFSNGILTQTLDFSNANVKYPVVADPYLGIDLISSVQVVTAGLFKNVSVAVTPWLGSQYVLSAFQIPWGHTAAVAIVQTFGWDEVLNKIGTRYGAATRSYVSTRPTFKDQFDCHALGAPVIFLSTITGNDPTPTWDLEGLRYPSRYLPTWINSLCNW